MKNIGQILKFILFIYHLAKGKNELKLFVGMASQKLTQFNLRKRSVRSVSSILNYSLCLGQISRDEYSVKSVDFIPKVVKLNLSDDQFETIRRYV